MNHLREIRSQRGMVIQQLAAASGVSPATIVACERHGLNPGTLKTRQRLADALGVHPADVWPDMMPAAVEVAA